MGREPELDALKKFTSVKSHTQRICKQSITGLAGTGKTQLVSAYAHDAYVKKMYRAVIWLNRVGDEGYFISLHHFATQILKLELSNLDKKASLYKIKEHLLQYSSILLIFDNVKTLSEIEEIIPIPTPSQNNQVHILVTSVDPNFSTDFEVIELESFTEVEATSYIGKILKKPDLTDAKRLAETLYFFPLALTQALAYIKLHCKDKSDINEYLELYETHKVELLRDEKPFPEDKHQQTVWVSWTLALQKIIEDYPVNKDKLLSLLNRCAYLASTDIAKEFLSNWVPDAYELNKCIAILKSYSLISSGKNSHTFDMHGLLQQMIRLKCSKPEEKIILAEMTRFFKKDVQLFDEDKVQSWSWMGLLYAHIHNFYNEIVGLNKKSQLEYEKESFGDLFIVANQFLSYMLNFKKNESVIQLAEHLVNIQNSNSFSNSAQQLETFCLLCKSAILQGKTEVVGEYFGRAIRATHQLRQDAIGNGLPIPVIVDQVSLNMFDIFVSHGSWDGAMWLVNNFFIDHLVSNESLNFSKRVKFCANLEFLSFIEQKGPRGVLLNQLISKRINEDFKVNYSTTYISVLIQIATQHLVMEDYEASYHCYKSALRDTQQFIREESTKKLFETIIGYLSFIPSVFLKKPTITPIITDDFSFSQIEGKDLPFDLLQSIGERNWALLLSGVWRPQKNEYLITLEACDKIANTLEDTGLSHVFYCKLAFILEKNNEFEKAAVYYAEALAHCVKILDAPRKMVLKTFSENLNFLKKRLKVCLKYVMKFDFNALTRFGSGNLGTGISKVELQIKLDNSRTSNVFFENDAFDFIFFFLFLHSKNQYQSLDDSQKFDSFHLIFNYLEAKFGSNVIHRLFAYKLIKTKDIAACKAMMEIMRTNKFSGFYQNIAQHLSINKEKAFEYLNDSNIETFGANGVSAYREKNYPDAIFYYLQSCKLLLSKVGGNDETLSTPLYNLGSAYMQIKEYKSAIIYLEKSTVIREKFLGKDDPSTIKVREKLKECQRHAHTEDEALVEIPRVQIREKLFKNSHDKQAKAQLLLETVQLRNYVLGNTLDQYDCFFDACAQALASIDKTQENGEPHDVQSLRQLCHHYVCELDEKMHKGEMSKEERWIYQKLSISDKYNDYLAAIYLPTEAQVHYQKYTVWERFINAFIICKKLNIGIHWIHIQPEDPAEWESGEQIVHLLQKAQGTEMTLLQHQFEMNDQDDALIHLIDYEERVAPLLRFRPSLHQQSHTTANTLSHINMTHAYQLLQSMTTDPLTNHDFTIKKLKRNRRASLP